MSDSPVLAAALTYARRGWHVLPCVPGGKAPLGQLVPRGLHNATTDERTIRQWLAECPTMNLGIRTGAVSGLLVLDIDPAHDGSDSLAGLELQHGRLPPTPLVLTGRGGFHHYFKHPGGHVPNQIGSLGAGIDLKADNAYVVAPPSHTVGDYTEELSADFETPLAPAPGWILQPQKPEAKPVFHWLKLLKEGVNEGERNVTLTSLVGHLLSPGRKDPYVVRELARLFNATLVRPPLGDDEVTRIVNSISQAQARKTGGTP